MAVAGNANMPCPRLVRRAANEVHVWLKSLSEPNEVAWQAARDSEERYLDRDERARADRFHFEKDRRLFIGARALLRTSLSQYFAQLPQAWQFAKTPLGKPFIVGPQPEARLDIAFSVSHADGLAAVAIGFSGVPVGLDLERLDRCVDTSIARRHFSPSEAIHILSQPAGSQNSAFLSFWTLKESYLKATGNGLTQPLTSAVFDLSHPPCLGMSIARRAPGQHCAWAARLWHPMAGYVAALCLPMNGYGHIMRIFRFDGDGRAMECEFAPVYSTPGFVIQDEIVGA